MASQSDYIWIRNWERFQHYKDRNPTWIKAYTEVLSSDDYLELSLARRGILCGLWLEFASSRRRLKLNTSLLSRRLNGRVTMSDLQSLNDAGFILFVDSKALARCERAYSKAIASRAPARSLDQKPEPEKDSGTNPVTEAKDASDTIVVSAPRNGTLDVQRELLLAELLSWIGPDQDDNTPAVLRHTLSQSTEAAIVELRDSMPRAHPRHRAKWVIGTLKQATERAKAAA